MNGTATAIVAQFEPPTTNDFVWDCWFPGLQVGGLEFCLNFITFLVLLGFLCMLAFFFFALRSPKVVPGKLQSVAGDRGPVHPREHRDPDDRPPG